MKRLFFALWPDAFVREQCAKIIEGLDSGKGRPVSPDNLHVTLVFLGNVSPAKEAEFRDGAAAIQIPKITIYFDQLSFWKKPGILCLTTTKPDQGLVALVNSLNGLTKKLAVTLDERTYLPHVTLIRKVDRIADFNFETVVWQSTSFCLVESCAESNRVEYRVIESW